MKAKCDRHFSFHPTGDPFLPWYSVRCLHIDNRFLVEVGNEPHPDWGFVDYVEERPDGTLVVETDREQGGWERLGERIRAGDPPKGEK